jgi:type I restriction enzyme, S subunit
MVDLSYREDEASVRPLHLPSGLAAADWGVEWRHLDRVCLDVIDCPHSTPRLTDGGPFVVRSQDILTGVLRLELTARVSEATYAERIGRAEPRYGDLLYSREGTYFGIAAEVPQGVKLCLGQRMVLIRPNPDIINHRYLRLWLNSPTLARHIHGHKDGSVAQRLNLPTIRSLPVPWRPVCDQDGIASMLGSLDDKIQLNRETSRTLEALAAAIFRSWFVDFDPVVAKAEGRPPFGMDPATAALFPDDFEDSPLGPIPLGWRKGCLADVAISPKRGVHPSELDEATPYIGLEHMPQRSIALGEWDTAARVTSGKLEFQRGEFLFGKLRPYFHKVGVAPTDGICSTDVVVVRPRRDEYAAFVISTISTEEFVAYTDAGSGGTRMPRTSWHDMARYRLAVPPCEVARRFNEMVSPMLSRIVEGVHESRVLVELRDLLLPKLLSGELRVRDAEKALAVVV